MASNLKTVVKSLVAGSVLALSISACCGCGWDCAPRNVCCDYRDNCYRDHHYDNGHHHHHKKHHKQHHKAECCPCPAEKK